MAMGKIKKFLIFKMHINKFLKLMNKKIILLNIF
jgi:hypothetical protein